MGYKRQAQRQLLQRQRQAHKLIVAASKAFLAGQKIWTLRANWTWRREEEIVRRRKIVRSTGPRRENWQERAQRLQDETVGNGGVSNSGDGRTGNGGASSSGNGGATVATALPTVATVERATAGAKAAQAGQLQQVERTWQMKLVRQAAVANSDGTQQQRHSSSNSSSNSATAPQQPCARYRDQGPVVPYRDWATTIAATTTSAHHQQHQRNQQLEWHASVWASRHNGGYLWPQQAATDGLQPWPQQSLQPRR